RRRLSMKPGITCIWQTTQNRNDVSFEDWMNMDLSYIDNWRLRLDFKILLQTAGTVFLGTGR
ncbi:MAG: sugar transferase, partial [Desulfobacterales bacterium]